MVDRCALEFSRLDARTVLGLLRSASGEQPGDLLYEVRAEIVGRANPRSRAGSWQEMWNSITGATATRPGRLEFHANIRCSTCHGKRIDMRRGAVCQGCMGRGRRNQRVSLTALFAPPPAVPITQE